MVVYSVVGARPQFVKAAVVSRALARAGIEERMVHTGQHYDARMSQVFFDELGIPEPAINLGVGSGTHARQTGEMMVGLEQFFERQGAVDWVLLYGDTNSTLAGALVAAKLHLPIAHVEAGLRSFDRRMPEEINRIVTDQLSDLLFCPTPTAVENLTREGMGERARLVGDVMFEATRTYAEKAALEAPLERLTTHGPGAYYLATVHRAENTDDAERLAGIFEGLGRLGGPVIVPLHPRTRARLGGVRLAPNVELREPVSYLAMLSLAANARRVLTDSGGLQKEAVWLGTPCITLRDETEWTETLVNGWNRIVGTSAERIVEAAAREPVGPWPNPDEGRAGARVAELLLAHPPP